MRNRSKPTRVLSSLVAFLLCLLTAAGARAASLDPLWTAVVYRDDTPVYDHILDEPDRPFATGGIAHAPLARGAIVQVLGAYESLGRVEVLYDQGNAIGYMELGDVTPGPNPAVIDPSGEAYRLAAARSRAEMRTTMHAIHKGPR